MFHNVQPTPNVQALITQATRKSEAVVLTVGSLQAGTKGNVIPDQAIIKLNVRTYDEGVRKHVLAAIERIVNAEAAASGAPKPLEITPLDRYSLVTNDPDATGRVVDAFRHHFPENRVQETNRHRPARNSDRSGPSGTFRLCSGSSAELTPP